MADIIRGVGAVIKDAITTWLRLRIVPTLQSTAGVFAKDSKFDPRVIKTKYLVDSFILTVLKKTWGPALKVTTPKLKSIVEESGRDTKQYAKDLGHHILLISLIPLYGWIEGPIQLSKMKAKCFKFMSDTLVSKFKAFKVEPDVEESISYAKQLLETDEWKNKFAYMVNFLLLSFSKDVS